MTSSAVSVTGLRKAYRDVVALDGVSFEVAEGSVLGLLGPNGSGKTTAVSILSTALRADAGQVTVCGFNVATQGAAVRRVIGLAGQFAAVDANLSGRENLALIGRLSRLPRSRARARAGELLERFGLIPAGDRLVRTYSGVMRRRLDVAAALVHQPPVLFLDEPTAGLDPESCFALWQALRELVAAGTTVLLTTQYLEEADALAERVVILDSGRVVEVGTPAELKARIGGVVFALGFHDDASAAHAEGVLHTAGYPHDREALTVRVYASDGSGALAAVLRSQGAREEVDTAPVVFDVSVLLSPGSRSDDVQAVRGEKCEDAECDTCASLLTQTPRSTRRGDRSFAGRVLSSARVDRVMTVDADEGHLASIHGWAGVGMC